MKYRIILLLIFIFRFGNLVNLWMIHHVAARFEAPGCEKLGFSRFKQYDWLVHVLAAFGNLVSLWMIHHVAAKFEAPGCEKLGSSRFKQCCIY